MSLCLNDALEIQAQLRQRRLAAQGKSVSPDLQAVLERFPELQKLIRQFAADAGSLLEITSAPENRMIAVRILHARSLPPNRSAFPDARQVTLLILGNATTFYFLAELGSGGSDINRAVQGSYLLTPETTLLNRLPNNETCEGPHLVVAERSLPWVIENFEALRAARHVAVRGWNQTLAALEKRIQGARADQHMELYHTPVRELLLRFPVLMERQDAEYFFRDREDLDKPLVDCIPDRKASHGEQQFRSRDLDHSFPRYHKVSKNPVFLKKMGLPANVENRLRQRMQDVKDALQHCRLTQGRWPGFCEITEVVPLNAKQWLLLDENGFSTVWNVVAPLAADAVKAQYCVPAAQMSFPPEVWSTCRHLLPKAEVQGLMEVSPEEDPFGLAAGFVEYLRRGIQSCGDREPADNVWLASLYFYFAHRLAPLWGPTREEIIALAQRGRPPYRIRDALECFKPEHARYSLLDQKDPPLNLLQAQVNCAETIRKLYENREFLDWKLLKT